VVIIAKVFGVGRDWDTYVSASQIPDQVYSLISGGALAYAFIPIFSGFLARKESDRAWHVASRVINTVFLATILISIIVFIFAPTAANIVAPGFDAAAKAQTAGLMRILLLGTLIFSVSGICMGILNSHNHFLLPAMAPIMYDLGILFGAIFLTHILGVRGIAVGAVLGAALHFAIQVPGLIRYKAHWYRELGWKDPALRQILRLMLPRMGVLGLIGLNGLVATNIASRLGTGSVSAYSWGWRLMQIPETLIGTAMGTVIFPTLAALSELGDESGKRQAMSGALRFILVATIPSAVGLILLGRPGISLLERGAFDASASALVYSALEFFALGLVVHSALEVVARSFYADKDAVTPFLAAFGGLSINLILSYLLSNVAGVERVSFYNLVASTFPSLGFQPYVGHVGGLALANSLGVTFEVLALGWVLRRRWHGLAESEMGRTIVKTLAASLAMGLVIIVVDAGWRAAGLAGRGLVYTVLQLVIEGGLGLVTFVVASLLLKMGELQTLIGLLLRRRRIVEVAA
jgi:putative peptidoglycan lipid II flippase